MRESTRSWLAGMLAFGTLVPAIVPAQTSSPEAGRRRVDRYSSAAPDFQAGREVYLRSTKTHIGVIEKTEANHSFPRSFPRPRMDAVLIRHTDGPRGWVPVEGITRIYVVGRPARGR